MRSEQLRQYLWAFDQSLEASLSKMLMCLSFLSDIPLYDIEKPYTLFNLPQEAIKPSNCVFFDQDCIPVKDLRGHEHSVTLEKNGFTFLRYTSRLTPSSYAFQSTRSDDPFVKNYLEETMQLIKSHVKADRVLCFDWRVGPILTELGSYRSSCFRRSFERVQRQTK